MSRLSDLANGHPKWDVVALTGDCAGVLPERWNDWPQSLKLSVPGNHDSPETFAHLTSWIHETPWFHRHDDLAFLGLDTSDENKPFGTLDDQLDPFWDEDITGVSAFVVLTHKWPTDDVVKAGQSLAKFIDGRQLLVLDGHNHPRGTTWETNANLGPIACVRSTVISCNVPKGTAHLVGWNGSGFGCEAVRGNAERKSRLVMPVSKVRFGVELHTKKEFQTASATRPNPWVTCRCGLSQKRAHRVCNFCGKALRDQ